MKEKTVEKVWEVTKKVTSYIAEDGTEFERHEDCEKYEDEIKLNKYWKKYDVRKTYVPTFIAGDSCGHGISFRFTEDGSEDEIKELINIFRNYEISLKDDRMIINWTYVLYNVRDEEMSVHFHVPLEKDKRYLFYFVWKINDDDYDYYSMELVSEEKARNSLKEEIREFKKMFDTEWNNENI